MRRFEMPGFRLPVHLGTLGLSLTVSLASASGFEGRIQAALVRGGETQTWLYTVSTNALRIERGETDRPHARNLVNLQTGERTLVFPHNRSFVRLKPASATASAPPTGFPTSPSLPPGVGPEGQPGSLPHALPPGIGPQTPGRVVIGPTNLPGAPAPPSLPALPAMPQPPAGLPPGVGPQPGGLPGAGPGMPAMPALPMMPMGVEPLELKATGQTTNLLGYACARYELRQRGEVMEIWATDKLLPFEPWQPNQPPRFGPRMLEEQWGELLRARKLFPLLAVLRFEMPALSGETNAPVAGPERLRFEVRSIRAEKIEDKDGTLFSPPSDYHEVQPLPF
jgi:hypothetical protein